MTSGAIERGGKDAPSTVATSDTAVETLSVSTTLAQTSRPVADGARADGEGEGIRQRRRAGRGERDERASDFARREPSRAWGTGGGGGGGRRRTVPLRAIRGAEPALAEALVPLHAHLRVREPREVRPSLRDARDAHSSSCAGVHRDDVPFIPRARESNLRCRAACRRRRARDALRIAARM